MHYRLDLCGTKFKCWSKTRVLPSTSQNRPPCFGHLDVTWASFALASHESRTVSTILFRPKFVSPFVWPMLSMWLRFSKWKTCKRSPLLLVVFFRIIIYSSYEHNTDINIQHLSSRVISAISRCYINASINMRMTCFLIKI